MVLEPRGSSFPSKLAGWSNDEPVADGIGCRVGCEVGLQANEVRLVGPDPQVSKGEFVEGDRTGTILATASQKPQIRLGQTGWIPNS